MNYMCNPSGRWKQGWQSVSNGPSDLHWTFTSCEPLYLLSYRLPDSASQSLWSDAVFSAEIPEFLSEEECRVVMQLAQLKGLMESQLMVQDGQEELAKELNLSPEEIFTLLDINQDGQLQLHEVTIECENFSWLTHPVSQNHLKQLFCPLTDFDSFASKRRDLAHTGESSGDL